MRKKKEPQSKIMGDREAKRVADLLAAEERYFRPKTHFPPEDCPHCINKDGVEHDHTIVIAPPPEATGIFDHIDRLIAAAFSEKGARVLHAEDAIRLKRAAERVRPTFDELMRVFVEPLRESKPGVAAYWREKLLSLVLDGFAAGSCSSLSDTTEKYAQDYARTEGMTAIKAEARAGTVAEQKSILSEELSKGGKKKDIYARTRARLIESGLRPVDERTLRRWKKSA